MAIGAMKSRVFRACSCGAAHGLHSYVHSVDCPASKMERHGPLYPKFETVPIIYVEPPQHAYTGLVNAQSLPLRSKPAKPRGPWVSGAVGRVTRKLPDYRMLLQFYFTRPIDVTLWRRIKPPPGWRKCPTSKDKQKQYCGVRFSCTDFKHELTPQQVQVLHATLLMILEV